MRLRKVIQRRLRGSTDGVDFVGDVNAAIAANVGERSQTTRVSSHSSAVSTQVSRDERRDQGERADPERGRKEHDA